jgi:hypothetical protein
MFVEELVLDGFKSYATRTVISGWDPEFNAITGLNGSGKSNILDSICFVLGISNLSQVKMFLPPFLMLSYEQVRATNLQDLVYKRGQAGVTKASVTIVFNNSDKKQSPIGFEQCDKITVTRQVCISQMSNCQGLINLDCNWWKKQVFDQWPCGAATKCRQSLPVRPAEYQQPSFSDYARSNHQGPKHETSRSFGHD